jgi:hypothetical protein
MQTEGIFRAVYDGNEVYEVSWPSVFVRGFIVGTFFYEFCGKTYIKSDTTGKIIILIKRYDFRNRI